MSALWQTNFEDAEHLLPGFPKFDSARLADERSITMEKVYQIAPAEFVPLVMSLPKKGRVHLIDVDGVWCWFQIDSVDVRRLTGLVPSSITGAETLRADTVLVRAELKMSLLKHAADPAVPPWELPCYRFRAAPVALRTAPRLFYPTAGDPLFGGGAAASLAPAPLVNTAGVPIQADGTRVLTRFSFFYNMRATAADYARALDCSWLWPGHCNASPVLFAGIAFPALTLMFESFSFEACDEPYSYPAVADGADTVVSGVWRYLKCSVRLLADPLSFARNYMNAGVHRLARRGIERLWQWTDDAGNLAFGSYADALSRADAQEVSENLFLNEAGTAPAPFGADGRQTAVFRRGVLEEPYDFNLLGLPADPPLE
ncbi:MAG: hypothetical protein IKE69_10455 [Thermoguttaceae bacterium]|nr:hypothetical protein [Thermoguttaceae bacterium]